jgi:hypothetical protein
MQAEQQEDEIRAFIEFARAASPSIDINSIESKDPPQPDILCSDGMTGMRAFELVELIDRIFARDLALCSGTKMILENYGKYIQPAEQITFRNSYGNALLYFDFFRKASLSRRERILPVVLRKLLNLPAGTNGDVLRSDRDFKGLLHGVSIARGTWHEPILDCSSGGSKENPISRTLVSKLGKKYSSSVPIELLAYYEGSLLIPDEIWMDSLADCLATAKKPLPFLRVWVFDVCDRKVKYCCDSAAQSLTPYLDSSGKRFLF